MKDPSLVRCCTLRGVKGREGQCKMCGDVRACNLFLNTLVSLCHYRLRAETIRCSMPLTPLSAPAFSVRVSPLVGLPSKVVLAAEYFCFNFDRRFHV